MLYAVGAAVIWGAFCGLLHAPFWAVAVGGLGAAALAIRLEWDALASPEARRRANFALLLGAAYVFLAVIGVGVVSLGYFLGEWLLARLPRF